MHVEAPGGRGGSWTRRALRRVGVVTSFVGSVVVGVLVALALVVVAVQLTGHRFLAVRTGSMAPAIPAGAAVVTVPRATAELQAGDVIVFHPPGWDVPVVHRVVRLDRSGSPGRPVRVVTRGDANNAVDSWGAVALAGSRTDVVVVSVPHLGAVLSWVWDGVVHGWLWAGVLAGVLAGWGWRHRRPRPVEVGS